MAGMKRFSLKQLFLGTAIIAVAICAMIPLADPFDNVAFTPAAWANAARMEERGRMSRDLVTNHLRKGLSLAQVEALIGHTEWVIKPGSPDGHRTRGAESRVYGIGSWPYHGLNGAFVYVHFDSNGQLIEAEINGFF
jgi:hypothetical protein